MNTSQSGNVLFYILIAVALLAALSYAVSQNNRGGGAGLSKERARLYATEVIDTAGSIATGVSQLRLRGVQPDDLCFDHTSWGNANYANPSCSDPQTNLYDLQGAGLNWAEAPREAMDEKATPDYLWHFYRDNEIEGVGTTTGTDTSADLILLVDELSLEVCQQINGLLGVTDADATPPTDTGYGTGYFAGIFTNSAIIGDEDPILANKNAACFFNTSDNKYAFYKVLVAR